MSKHLFVGNPGVGKSTLLNCFLGQVGGSLPFQSGISFGQGKTTMFQSKTVGADTFIDTPGLADQRLRQEAAAAIKQGLMQGGFYKIIFVMLLFNGRVRADDVTTMKLVLEAAPITNYGIIFNMVGPKVMQMLQDNPTCKEAVLGALWNDLPPSKRTSHIVFMPNDPALQEGENVIKPLPSEVVFFIRDLPGMEIAVSRVQDVKTCTWESSARETERTLAQLREQSERQALVRQRELTALRQQQQLLAMQQVEREQRLRAQLDMERRQLQGLRFGGDPEVLALMHELVLMPGILRRRSSGVLLSGGGSHMVVVRHEVREVDECTVS